MTLNAFVDANTSKTFNLYVARPGAQALWLADATPDVVARAVATQEDALCRIFEVTPRGEMFSTAFANDGGVVTEHPEVTIPTRFW